VRDIHPLLQAVMNTRWTHEPAQPWHYHWDWAKLADQSTATEPRRNDILRRVRVPPSLTGLPKAAGTVMPRLMGDEQIDENGSAPVGEDNRPDSRAPRRPISRAGGPKLWLTITPVQYSVLLMWKKGKFDKPGWPASNRPSDLLPPPRTVTPWGLDQAALENCVGGAFFPGIEVGWLIRNPQLYKVPGGNESIFRVNPWTRRIDGSVLTNVAGTPILRRIHYGSVAGGKDIPLQAGYFSKQMALPWQADFWSCSTDTLESVLAGWWPAQRPDNVHVTRAGLPMSATTLAAFDSTVGMSEWTQASPASATAPERRGSIADRAALIAHFEKLGFVRAADALGDAHPNRDTVYVEQERNPIPP
jgi:hypothetical protein